MKQGIRGKKDCEKAVRVNISIPPTLWIHVESVIRKTGYSGLSDYVQGRIRRDAGLEPEDRVAA